jgi:hypothetical protein
MAPNNITLVSSPDDISQDGLRICLVGLSKSQSHVISDSFNLLDHLPNTIVYIWNNDDLNWLIDKKQKSDIIIFNAEHENQELIGYFSAQPNSYYLGTLRTLEIINKRSIHDIDQLISLLKESILKYEEQF